MTSHHWTTGPHTAAFWDAASGIRAEIQALPFLTELASGTLAPASFVEYLQQDSFYLAQYSRALAVLAARAPSRAASAFWAGSAQTAVAEEEGLHRQLMGDPLLAGRPRPERPSPTTRGYTGELLTACALEPYEVGAAAVLPCFWIYADVGQRLASQASGVQGHPYGRWVAEYGDPEFARAAQTAVDLVEEAAAGASEGVRSRMLEAFLDALRWEQLFWDAAYRREAWPRPQEAWRH